jgi:hypothetical protein
LPSATTIPPNDETITSSACADALKDFVDPTQDKKVKDEEGSDTEEDASDVKDVKSNKGDGLHLNSSDDDDDVIKKEEAKKEEDAPKKKKGPKSSEPSLSLSSKSSSEDLIGKRTLRKRKFTLTSVEEQDEKSEEVNDAQSEGRQSSGTIRKNLA